MTVVPINLDNLAGPGIRRAAAPYSNNVRRRLLAVFLVALLLPIQPQLGGQRLDPYRLLLLILFLPFVTAMLKRRAGQFTLSDVMMVCYSVWIVVTLVIHHGMAKLAYASILAIMLLGGYMAGRLLIRNLQDYIRFIQYFIILLLSLLPFAIAELITGRMIIADVLGKVFPVMLDFDSMRYGLFRVQVVFPHAILFGLFCSIGFGNVLYIYRGQFFGCFARLVLVIGMTIMSLSSAPLLSLGLQSIAAVWDKMTRGRWMLLLLGFAGIYIFLSLASNRGPVIILIETLTFNPGTAWWRVYIWEYGIQNVMNHPLIGLGLNDWVRPSWLSPTVDNFWLLTAMQAGIPALIFLVVALLVHIFRIVRANNLNAQTRSIRTGYIVVLAGTAFTLSTVHVWDALAVFIMFFIGSGSFLYTSPAEGEKKGGLQGPSERELASQNESGKTRTPIVYARTHLSKVDKVSGSGNTIRKIPLTYVRRINKD